MSSLARPKGDKFKWNSNVTQESEPAANHPAPATVTFIGHSSVLLEMGGRNILTDPNFSRWVWTQRRRSTVGLDPGEIDAVDLMLISHGHYDHLDTPSLRRLPREAVVFTPRGTERYPQRLGFCDVRVLDKWEAAEAAGMKVTAVPARHFSGRHPLNPMSGYTGYVIEGPRTVYFAGDTGLFDDMRTIGERFTVDLALLPIGAYRPWHYSGHHMNPEDAIEAARRVQASQVVPIHWGAFKLSLEPMEEPPVRLLAEAERSGLRDRVHVLRPGERLEF